MIVLDTDHLGILQVATSAEAQGLIDRLETSDEEVATTIVSVEEQIRGWLAAIRRRQDPHDQIGAYARLQRLFDFFGQWVILPWDKEAATELTRLKKNRVRIGTMDLKIASIARTRNGLLLSRNLRDFQKVPGLRVENWLS